ncbi:MAG: fibronectin type III domain-containing protein [Lentisphaeria bacterium]|nr:fibronectin type III domain-containing protein [Candidatus Neomarinimicrobiota bacterium]MCF7842511.1 fibronectin type III domain-containing protein [Lentisphaeria bacterium]
MIHFDNSFRQFRIGLVIILALVFIQCAGFIPTEEAPAHIRQMDRKSRVAFNRVNGWLQTTKISQTPVPLPIPTSIDSLHRKPDIQVLEIYFSEHFSHLPWREENVARVYGAIKKTLGWRFRNYTVKLYSLEIPLEQLIPNIFRSGSERYDRLRMPLSNGNRPVPIVQNLSKSTVPEFGLWGRNIVVWPSHGWYYNNRKDVWEWQRPRLFQTVEDLLPYAFVIPYLAPMLENAGAHVFIPRERDIQTHEVIIDNDSASTTGNKPNLKISQTMGGAPIWEVGDSVGFAVGNPPYPANFNPFGRGAQLVTRTDTLASASVHWIPQIPETGEYAVYVTYCRTDSSSSEVHYQVRHLGGATDFRVNQSIGGNTWLYLGKFRFATGYSPNSGAVVLMNDAMVPGKVISADAVRFGGGMGIVMRNGRTSGRPKFTEGSRYYLQYAGMPDTLVYVLNEDEYDYRDDYQSRAEYANYLYGAPFGPTNNRLVKGLGIPIDVSMAFHTDAGIKGPDSTVGTLMIYSLEGMDSTRYFPDGMSRLANRDLGDIVQTQIVRDIRKKYDPTWKRRQLMDALYSEAARPNMPGILLELLSHQNFTDMKYASDPAFRFDVARSIYKGMLKFISSQHGMPYMVQPLPIQKFEALLTDSDTVLLRWQPELDPLEPTAKPQAFRVYSRLGDAAFDNGELVGQHQIELKNLAPGEIYSFRVTAVNGGGESFPSPTLSVGIAPVDTLGTALIVDGFDRVSGPAVMEADQFMGMANFIDAGVADRIDINFTGEQYAFDPHVPYHTNAFPGHGSSYANEETLTRPGNTRDYTRIHGKALLANGYSFCSVTRDGWLADSLFSVDYALFDLSLGEQRAVKTSLVPPNEVRYRVLPENLQQRLRMLKAAERRVLISGAYVATDPLMGEFSNDSTRSFVKSVLNLRWISDHANRSGDVIVSDSLLALELPEFQFNQGQFDDIYIVESPDALQVGRDAVVLFRYGDNQFPAGYFYPDQNFRLVVLGFPFESVEPGSRTALMRGLIQYLETKKF